MINLANFMVLDEPQFFYSQCRGNFVAFKLLHQQESAGDGSGPGSAGEASAPVVTGSTDMPPSWELYAPLLCQKEAVLRLLLPKPMKNLKRYADKMHPALAQIVDAAVKAMKAERKKDAKQVKRRAADVFTGLSAAAAAAAVHRSKKHYSTQPAD